ncbi:hypothetical protein [Streptomyces sp. JJ36]|uniref:hypothetical protein n=1 Tax=Streptomyces sp. JJ36 TaxID=2736645 RepID=UPI001F417F7F|nr:hypothetical protein [Streptomyces sp. JJ36]MCF6522058.1 hypothetical protein [Streptomyces sp. JJ36]
MTLPDRQERELRRMLDGSHAPLPADLALRARSRGDRLLRRRHALRSLLWTLAFLAALALASWAAVAEPWSVPSRDSTPPVYRW